jgi:hypothetical protein
MAKDFGVAFWQGKGHDRPDIVDDSTPRHSPLGSPKGPSSSPKTPEEQVAGPVSPSKTPVNLQTPQSQLAVRTKTPGTNRYGIGSSPPTWSELVKAPVYQPGLAVENPMLLKQSKQPMTQNIPQLDLNLHTPEHQVQAVAKTPSTYGIEGFHSSPFHSPSDDPSKRIVIKQNKQAADKDAITTPWNLDTEKIIEKSVVEFLKLEKALGGKSADLDTFLQPSPAAVSPQREDPPVSVRAGSSSPLSSPPRAKDKKRKKTQ